MPRSRDLLTLSREDLYELAWSKPMTELAKDFGISDVALAKRCRKLGVPVPGRGYWARVAAGQTPRQPKLKQRNEKATDHSALTFDPPPEDPATPVPTTEAPEHTALREKLRALQSDPSHDLLSSTPVIKRTAVRLKRPWRSEINWNRGERKGPVFSTDVSEDLADRALTIADHIIAGAAEVGWPFKAPPEEEPQTRRYSPAMNREVSRPGCLYVEGEPLEIRIDERKKRIDHVLTESEKARQRRGEYFYASRWDYIPSGEIRLTVTRPDSRYHSRTWKDGARRKLEDQVNHILLALLDEAIQIKADREERRLAEIERRREEKLRWQQSQRRSANAKLVHELEAQAGAWRRARFLRSYLRALRRALGNQSLTVKRQDETVDFLEWAQHYVDQLDPLCPTPHDPDLKADQNGYYTPPDAKVDAALSRLLGQHWENAFKIGESERPEGDDSATAALFDEYDDDD